MRPIRPGEFTASPAPPGAEGVPLAWYKGPPPMQRTILVNHNSRPGLCGPQAGHSKPAAHESCMLTLPLVFPLPFYGESRGFGLQHTWVEAPTSPLTHFSSLKTQNLTFPNHKSHLTIQLAGFSLKSPSREVSREKAQLRQLINFQVRTKQHDLLPLFFLGC